MVLSGNGYPLVAEQKERKMSRRVNHVSVEEKHEDDVLNMLIAAREMAIRAWRAHLMTTGDPVDVALYTECIENFLRYNEANMTQLHALRNGERS